MVSQINAVATMGSISPLPVTIGADAQDYNSTKDQQVVGNTYEIPNAEPHSSFDALKERIRFHYEQASDYYYRLWYVRFSQN